MNDRTDFLKEVAQLMEGSFKDRAELITNVLIPIANKERGELTKEDIEKAQEITCYGLGFCCSREKECLLRDSALAALGVSDEEFDSKKEWATYIVRAPQLSARNPPAQLGQKEPAVNIKRGKQTKNEG